MQEETQQFKNLTKEITDIEKYISEDLIKVIRITEFTKDKPSDRNYYLKKISLKQLKQHKGNYGLIVGYNHNKTGKSIAVIDIDGYKITKSDGIPLERKAEIKQLTKEYIFNCLKNIPNALIVKTQSGGYHIYLWNETVVDNFHNVSKSLTFPEDFPIVELRNKSLKHSIEIFTKFKSKYVDLPSNLVKDNGSINKYKVISTVNKLSEVGTVNNIHNVVKETMLASGYGIAENTTSTSRNRKRNRSSNSRRKDSKKLKTLTESEVKKVVDIVTKKYNIFEATEGAKNDTALHLGGYFTYHITKESSSKIAEGIIAEVGSLFKDNNRFRKTLLDNYERPVKEKTGLRTLLEHIEDLNSDFNINGFSEEINLICNSNFKRTKITTTKINKNEVPVYLYENDSSKWLKYEGILKGIDLTLNFSSLIGSLKYSETGKEVDSFKFRFNNNSFEIIKFKELKDFLAEVESITLPEHFVKLINRSLRSLDYSITKPKIKTINPVEDTVKEDLPEDVVIFGVNENFYFQQSEEKGIEAKTITEKGIKTKPVAKTIIRNLEIVINPLKLTEKEKEIEPVYNVTYYNKTLGKEVTSTYLTDKELTEEFIKAKVFYSSTKENVDTVLNAFIIDGAEEGIVKVKSESFLEGFFIVNGRIVENTKLQNLKKYTSEDVAEAINLLNTIMKDRTAEGKANDSTVYRFMLWNPYSYCLKQLGLKTGIYSLILIGISKGNKTGAIKIGNLFYSNTEEESSGSTVSVLGSKLEENSFSKVFDECYNLINLPEAPDIMKKAVQDKTTRITKDRTDNKKMDKFNAFGLPVFLLNERMEFKDYIRERYKITEYTSKSYVPKDKRKAFNKKYLPEAEDTELNKLAIIGNEFKKKIVPLIEAKDKKLLNPEEVTINILKEIAEETTIATGKPIDFLPELYNITEASTNYNYDVTTEIAKLLNNEFKKKNRITGNSSYSGFTFTNSIINNDFDFITYNKYRSEDTAERHFIINTSKLVKYVNNKVEETVELDTILNALNLTDILKAKATEKGFSLEEFLKKQYKVKIDGAKKPKNITGFYLSTEELANNLFSFNIDFSAPEKKTEFKIMKVENKN